MSDIENNETESPLVVDGAITVDKLDGGDVDWKSTAEALQEELNARKVYPYEDGDFLVLGPEIFTKIDDQSAIMYKGVAYGIKQRDLQPKDLKKYDVGELVEVQKNAAWLPGRISSKSAGALNVDTERGPVTVMSYHIIRKVDRG